MSNESKLIKMGAECVCGDLILNSKTVAHYRNGSCIVTEDGLLVLQEAAEAAAGAVEEVPERTATPAKSAKKKKDLPPVEEVTEVKPADETAPVTDQE